MPKALQTEALLLLPLLLLPPERQYQAASLIVRSTMQPQGIPVQLRLPALHALNLADISSAACADAAAMLEQARSLWYLATWCSCLWAAAAPHPAEPLGQALCLHACTVHL